MTCHILRGRAASGVGVDGMRRRRAGAPLDIGFIGTVRRPHHEDERDAFMRWPSGARRQLGGVLVNVRVEDDALRLPTLAKPPTGKTACASSRA